MRGLAAVGLTLIGVWLMVLSIGMALSTLSAMVFMAAVDSSIGPVTAYTVNLVVLLCYGVLGVLLIEHRHRLAARLFPDEQVSVAVHGEQAVRLGLVLLGVYLVAQAVAALSPLLIRAFFESRVYTNTPPSYSELARRVVELALGAILARTSHVLADRFWFGWARRAEPEADQSDESFV